MIRMSLTALLPALALGLAAPALAETAMLKLNDLDLSTDAGRAKLESRTKALARKLRILILDEATSALTAADVTKIYTVLKRLRSDGLALLYISRRMHWFGSSRASSPETVCSNR